MAVVWNEAEILRRSDAARTFFRDGYNCAQATAMAFADVIGQTPDGVAKAMAGFGGGFGRLREVCGCVSGMTYAANFLVPSFHPEKMEERKANYALVQELAGAYKEAFGSIICRELLEMKKTQKAESPAPSERTSEYYAVRPCEAQVGKAAEILARKIAALQA